MNNPTYTDPEELRLLQEAAKLGKNMMQLFAGSEAVTSASGRALVGKLRQIDDHRAKASAQVAPLLDRLEYARLHQCDCSLQRRASLGHAPMCKSLLAAEALEAISVASPSNTDIRQLPTDEAIAAWLRETRPTTYFALIRKAVTHFSPELPPAEPKNLGEAQGQCETTLTERFAYPGCTCGTYAGNLGPCKTFENNANGDCVYCDHAPGCHAAILRTQPDTPNTSTANGLEQENASQPAGSAQQDPTFGALFDKAFLETDDADCDKDDLIAQRDYWRMQARNGSTTFCELMARSPTQTQITDEEISSIWGQAFYQNLTHYDAFGTPNAFARLLLAEHSPSISDDQLKDLWKLAKTEDLQVFLTDARGVVGR